MVKSIHLKVVVLFFVILSVENVTSRPNNRIKRVSDQRLAELETLVALSKMSGQLVTVPLGYGKVNPKYIGRKRRSENRILDVLFNQSAEVEDSGDPMELNYEDIYKKR